MATIEITVLGAGIFGLSIAWELTRRGANVQVVDPHGPATGASGGIVGALSSQWKVCYQRGLPRPVSIQLITTYGSAHVGSRERKPLFGANYSN